MLKIGVRRKAAPSSAHRRSDHASKSGMPSYTDDFAPQLIWLAIIFTLFYFALSQLALPRIERVLKDRKTKIGGDLQAARDAQHNADKEAERYEAEIAAAKTKGHGMIRASREKLDGELGEKRKVSTLSLPKRRQRLRNAFKASLSELSGRWTR